MYVYGGLNFYHRPHIVAFCPVCVCAPCPAPVMRRLLLNAFCDHAPGCCSRTPCRTPNSSPARAAGRRRGLVGTTVVRASRPSRHCPLVEGPLSIETAGKQLSSPACAAPTRHSSAFLAPRMRSAAQCPLPPAPAESVHATLGGEIASARSKGCESSRTSSDPAERADKRHSVMARSFRAVAADGCWPR